MADNASVWGIEEDGGALVRFPVGDTVLAPTPLRESLFAEVDRLLAADRCSEGRFEVEAGDTRLTCLIHQSAPYLAGLQERDVYSQVPLADFASRVRQLSGAICTLIATDNACVLMVGVHFCKRPYLQGSTRLVNPAHVLRVLAKEKQDAAMSFVRGGTRTLLFLNQGQPARLYFGEPRDDPGEGSLSDRVLLYAFADSAPPSTVEVFTSLKLPADPARGTAFVELAAATRPPPPVVVHLRMADGREIRQRVFSPPSMVIGRDPTCTLFIDNLVVSRQHARILWEEGGFVVEDLGSSNGTRVGGEPVTRAAVAPGDRIEVGKFQVELVELPSMPSAPETVFVRPQDVQPARAATSFAVVGDDQTLTLTGDVLVGRGAGVDLQARGWFIGSPHARISVGEHGRFHLDCFGNRKVWVGGRKVGKAHLRPGDAFALGKSEFRIEAEHDETLAMPKPPG
jgi:FHA domain